MSLLDTPLGGFPLGSDPEGVWVGYQDVVLFDETTGADLEVPWADTLRFSEDAQGVVSIQVVTAETLFFSEESLVHLSETTEDTIQFSDAAPVELSVWVADTVTFSEEAHGVLALTEAVEDTVNFSDEHDWIVIAETVDTLQFSDESVVTASLIAPEITDTVQFSEEVGGGIALIAPEITDTLSFLEESLSVMTLVATWEDTLWFSEELADAHEQILVVTNLETGAVSRYVVTPALHSLAEFRGTLYLAGPDGLYAMDAAADDDGPVAWTIRTGFSALGADLLKRIQDVNVLARTQGDTTLTVISAREGDRIPWPYPLPPLARAAYRDGVIKVGKGVQSVYYQLDWAGAGPAEIDQLRLTVEPLSRRR